VTLPISLCMIVRDEADLLPACLASVRGVVGEMIVVDTGSQDDTVNMAQKVGATVASFPSLSSYNHHIYSHSVLECDTF